MRIRPGAWSRAPPCGIVPRVRRFGFILLALFGTLVVLAFGILLSGVLWIRGSLPLLEGNRTVEAVTAPVALERDSLGVAVVRAVGWHDGLLGVGFAHGQDRYFQMDLVRRLMTGELAQLVGPDAVASDRQMRAYGYRDAAALHLRNLPPHHRAALDAYVAGVNAGIGSLGSRPPEYVLLRSRPAAWTAEDAVLTYLYFYHVLSTHYREERHIRELHLHLPEPVARFLTPETSRFDQVVPGMGPDAAGGGTGGYQPLGIPPAAVFDLRRQDEALPDGRRALRIYGDLPGGSNAWAVGGTEGEPALLAGDPHLSLQVPGTWYRAEVHWQGGVVRGATLPGLPGFLVGMTDHLAWSATAAMVDQTDLVELELHPEDPSRYRTPEGWSPFQTRPDTVRVRGGDDVIMMRRLTRWGPVVRMAPDSTLLALRSPAFDPGGITMEHLEVAHARSVHDAVAVARRMGGPGLGLVFGDAAGRTAWVVSGVLPGREGMDGRRPVAAGTGAVRWTGPRPESDRPVVVDSAGGYLFAANQRFASLSVSRTFSGHWVSPTRARRIDELLSADGGAALDESVHYAHQLDTRSLEHEFVRVLILDLLPDPEDPDADPDAPPLGPGLVTLRAQAVAWDGHADATSPHFRTMEAAGRALRGAALGPLLGVVLLHDPEYRYGWLLAHEPAFRILEERPAHLLPPGEESWESYLRRALQRAASDLGGLFGDEGWETPWGEVNVTRIVHPFSTAQPALARFLNMPGHPMPGWLGAVRAQSPEYGQSLRFVGRPGSPQGAILDMPGGQSGHPVSRWYDAGHLAWVRATATPLTAGPAEYRLMLNPPSR
ncbi:MAG: penicillin acylase family protein [Gemmatimonadales bacterium]|nr:MAG: penicillin acylase family protein [Gemmatimonadales bacterium]